MPDDYYEDDSETMTATPAPDKEDTATQSSLVPKSFFAGKKDLEVGDTEVVKVLRILDDEVEIECVKENYDDEEATEEVAVESDEMME
jgi:hypothetical protein